MTTLQEARTLNELVAARAAGYGSRPYITFLQDGDRDERRLTFADLERRALAVARLLADGGLTPGDRVLIVLPTGLEFIETFYGILLAGMVPVPVYPPARLARLDHYLSTLASILDVSRCHGAVVDARLLPLVGSRLAANLVVLTDADVRDADGSASPYAALGSSPGFIQFTSGTTSRPRGVLLRQDQILAQLSEYLRCLDARPGEVAVTWLPLYHDLGLIGNVLATLSAGMHLILLSPLHFLKEPMTWIRAISRHGGHFAAAPNFAYELCVRKCSPERLQAEGIDLSSVRNFGCGAEPVSMATLERFQERFAPFGLRPNVLNPSFGIAENTLVATIHRTGESFRSLTLSREALQRGRAEPPTDAEDAVTMPGNGRPMPGITIAIVGPDGDSLPERWVGEVWIRSPSLAAGYFNDPEATHSAFVRRSDGRWLKTGDLGFLADGDLYICGRKKDTLIVRGRNYYPQDLEEVVSRIPGVRPGNVAVFGIAGADGERPVLACELDRRNPRPADALRADIVEAISATFGLALADVVFVADGALPKTSSGKLQRSLCREAYLAGKLTDGKREAAPAALKARLALAVLRDKLGGGRRQVLGRKRAPDGADGPEALDPRVVEALQSAQPDLDLELSPRLRLDALGLDSLERMEFWVALEERYDATVPEDDWNASQTLGAAQRVAERYEGTGRSVQSEGGAAMPLLVRDLLADPGAAALTTDRSSAARWRQPWTAEPAFGALAAISRSLWGLEADGVANVPSQGPVILAGNHVSYLDAGWVLSVLGADIHRRCVAIAWEKLPPFTRWFLAQVETIPIDPQNAFREAIRAGLTALRDDKALVIFPEGSRSYNGQMSAFRPGIGILGILSGCPIVPFRIRGGFEIYSRNQSLPRFAGWKTRPEDRLRVSFGPPVSPPAPDASRTWQQVREFVELVQGAVAAL